eukprot:GEZU01041242.1.p1 GENE.GEZU01041242.1~~GEZU01041242.1.p1  ORF type:complete len:133 (-),score=19.41 GEZU01041242.1:46-444(-)
MDPITIHLNKSNETTVDIPLTFVQMQAQVHELVQATRDSIAEGYNGVQHLTTENAQKILDGFLTGSCTMKIYSNISGTFVPYNDAEDAVRYNSTQDVEANTDRWTSLLDCDDGTAEWTAHNISNLSQLANRV